MAGKLNVFNLGDLGVDLVQSPIHTADGSFLRAQNAAVSQDQAQHGLRKRPGMARINGMGLGGAVIAYTNVPFPEPDDPY